MALRGVDEGRLLDGLGGLPPGKDEVAVGNLFLSGQGKRDLAGGTVLPTLLDGPFDLVKLGGDIDEAGTTAVNRHGPRDVVTGA